MMISAISEQDINTLDKDLRDINVTLTMIATILDHAYFGGFSPMPDREKEDDITWVSPQD